MIIAGEEKRSQGPLIVFIDLLFLLVAFFVLLLFFIQSRQDISEKEMEQVEQSLARITGEEVSLPKALSQLETIVDRFLSEQKQDLEKQRQLARRRQRKAQRKSVRLEYNITPAGNIRYEGQSYAPGKFMAKVVNPLRRKNWITFRGYASPETPFGKVIASRRLLLKEANEFDTYWDNISRNKGQAGGSRP